MSHGLGAVCDEFYVSCRVFTKLELAPDREALLHFLDRVHKEFPTLRKIRRREGHGVMIEDDGEEQSTRRWMRIDKNGLRFGQYSPESIDDVRRLATVVLEHAPYFLSFSELDYDHLEVAFGFDLQYRGNHDQLVAETLLSDQGAGAFLFGGHAAHVIDVQPYLGIALTPECDLQAYVEVKSRTTSYEARQQSFESQPISVLLTVRKYWSMAPPASLVEGCDKLFDQAAELAVDRVIPHVVNPLAAAISSRS